MNIGPLALNVKGMFLFVFTNKIFILVLLKVTDKTKGDESGMEEEERNIGPGAWRMALCESKMFQSSLLGKT